MISTRFIHVIAPNFITLMTSGEETGSSSLSLRRFLQPHVTSSLLAAKILFTFTITCLTTNANAVPVFAVGNSSGHSVLISTTHTSSYRSNSCLYHINPSGFFNILHQLISWRQLAMHQAKKLRNAWVMFEPSTAQLLLYVPPDLTFKNSAI